MFKDPLKRFLLLNDAGGGTAGGGTTGDSVNNPTGDGGDGGVKTFDETYVKQLRSEAAQYRTKAKELEQKLQTMPQEITAKVLQALGLEPDPNKNFEKQLEEARAKARDGEQRANERLMRAEVKALATEMGLVDADAALALMDRSKVAVKDDGTVEGAKEALEALVAAKPWLKKAPGQTVGGGTNPPGAGNTQTNPWKNETFNLTLQGKILKENPALAQRLMAEAGVKF
jgi:hypothetical protein